MKPCGFLDSSLIHWKEVVFASTQQKTKMFLFCSSLLVLRYFIHAIGLRFVLKTGSVKGQKEGSSGKVQTADGRDLKVFVV